LLFDEFHIVLFRIFASDAMFSLAQLMYATSEAELEAAKMEFFAADDDSDEFLSPSRRY